MLGEGEKTTRNENNKNELNDEWKKKNMSAITVVVRLHILVFLP
jgi:hypothetical protein